MLLLVLTVAVFSGSLALPTELGFGGGYVRCPDGSQPLTDAAGQPGPVPCTGYKPCPQTHQCVQNKGAAAGVCCPRVYGGDATGVSSSPSLPVANGPIVPCPPPPQPTEEQAKNGCHFVAKNATDGIGCSNDYDMLCESASTPAAGPGAELSSGGPGLELGSSSTSPASELETASPSLESSTTEASSSSNIPFGNPENGSSTPESSVDAQNASTPLSPESGSSENGTATGGDLPQAAQNVTGLPETDLTTVESTAVNGSTETSTGGSIESVETTGSSSLAPSTEGMANPEFVDGGLNGTTSTEATLDGNSTAEGSLGSVGGDNGSIPLAPVDEGASTTTAAAVEAGSSSIATEGSIQTGENGTTTGGPETTSGLPVGPEETPSTPSGDLPDQSVTGLPIAPEANASIAQSTDANETTTAVPSVDSESSTSAVSESGIAQNSTDIALGGSPMPVEPSEVTTASAGPTDGTEEITSSPTPNATSIEPLSPSVDNGTSVPDESSTNITLAPGTPDKKPPAVLPSIDEPTQNQNVIPEGSGNTTTVEPAAACPPDAPACPLPTASESSSIPPVAGGENSTDAIAPSSESPSSVTDGSYVSPPTGSYLGNETEPSQPQEPVQNGTSFTVPMPDEFAGVSVSSPNPDSSSLGDNGTLALSTVATVIGDSGLNASEPLLNETTAETPSEASTSGIPSETPAVGGIVETTSIGSTESGQANETVSTAVPELPSESTAVSELGGVSSAAPELGNGSISETTTEATTLTFGNETELNSTVPDLAETSTTIQSESSGTTLAATFAPASVEPSSSNGSYPNISESINPNPESVPSSSGDEPTWDSMFSIRNPLKSIPDAVAFRRSSGPAMATSGQFVPCQRNADCFDLREPAEWCQTNQPSFTWTDKSCFCAADTEVQSCIIERFDLASGQTQWTFCTPDTEFVCDKNYRRKA